MKRLIPAVTTAVVVVASVVLGTGSTAGAAAGNDGGLTAREKTVLSLGLQVAPKAVGGARPAGPNPFLANVADLSTVDYSGWRAYASAQAAASQSARSAAAVEVPQPVKVKEREAKNVLGKNDTIAKAQRIGDVGTDPGDRQAALISGAIAPPVIKKVNRPAVIEDNGSIPLATVSGVSTQADAMTVASVIGDGPHGTAGSGSGDFDVFKVTLKAGEALAADTSALRPLPVEESLDTVLLVYDAAGEILAVDDDSGSTPFSSLVEFIAPAAGNYYVLVSTFGGGIFPDDPFDSGSGAGAGPEGAYDLTITTGPRDIDFYSFDLDAGDVLGATLSGGGKRLQVFDPTGTEVVGSTFDLSFIYPASSPLPGGGNVATAHVVNTSGRHYVAVSSGRGPYEALVEIYRAGLQTATPGSVQTIFLDFNGARLNTNIFGGPGVRTLSPLRSFLSGWGLRTSDESRLITAIVANATENIQTDLVAQGLNPNVTVRILNSRDHADPFGQDNVSRIIIGGTINESGIPTIGIAQSIDPGNFGQEETALVLLDILSGPLQVLEEGEEPDDPSLNAYLKRATTNRIAAVAQGVGNVTAHEAGHFLGNYHTDQFNDQPNLQDQGGNFANLFGTGPDLILGTRDDIDVDFGRDVYVPNEGLTGIEDTLNNVSFGLAPGPRP